MDYSTLKVKELRNILEKKLDHKLESGYIKKQDLIEQIEKITSYKYISGVEDYTILEGTLDDNIIRRIYLFHDLHTLKGECYDMGMQNEYENKDAIRITKYLLDSFQYAEDKNFMLDFYIETERYRKEHEYIEYKHSGKLKPQRTIYGKKYIKEMESGAKTHLGGSDVYTSFYQTLRNSGSIYPMHDVVYEIENRKCGQYQKLILGKSQECPYNNTRIHYIDERDWVKSEKKYYEVDDLHRDYRKGLNLYEILKIFHEKTQNEYLFLSKSWYIEYMFSIMTTKIFKQWEKSSSKYYFDSQYHLMQEYFVFLWHKNLKKYLFEENYVQKLRELEILLIKSENGNENIIPKILESLNYFEYFLIELYSPLLDLYFIGRMLKLTTNDEVAQNIIFLGGSDHSYEIAWFLKRNGFSITSESQKIKKDTDEQCLNIDNLPYPAFSDVF